MKLADKQREDAIRRRIRALADERKVALSAIALKAGVEQDAVKALYRQEGVKKKRVSEVTAAKLEKGLDEQERALGMVKRCGKCGRTLPFGAFSVDRHKRDGMAAKCRDCNRAANKEWRDKKKSDGKKNDGKEETVNNNTENAMTAEIVRRVKAEDKRDVESKFMAPYFGLTPKQLDEVRKGIWDKLLLTPSEPKRADTVLEAVERLRCEVAALRREVETVMVEMGVDVKVGEVA